MLKYKTILSDKNIFGAVEKSGAGLNVWAESGVV